MAWAVEKELKTWKDGPDLERTTCFPPPLPLNRVNKTDFDPTTSCQLLKAGSKSVFAFLGARGKLYPTLTCI